MPFKKNLKDFGWIYSKTFNIRRNELTNFVKAFILDWLLWYIKWTCNSYLSYFFKKQTVELQIYLPFKVEPPYKQPSRYFFLVLKCIQARKTIARSSVLPYLFRPKKVVFFPEIGRVKKTKNKKHCYSTTRIVECVSEYIFSFSNNKQASKKKRIQKKQEIIRRKIEYLQKMD